MPHKRPPVKPPKVRTTSPLPKHPTSPSGASHEFGWREAGLTRKGKPPRRAPQPRKDPRIKKGY